MSDAAPGDERYPISVDSVETGSDELAVQLPVRAQVLRRLPGPDRPDYSLAGLRSPLRVRSTTHLLAETGVDLAGLDRATTTVHDDGSVVALVYGLVLAPRTAGVRLATPQGAVAVATALVLDTSQMTDRTVRFEKVFYAAVTWVTRIC